MLDPLGTPFPPIPPVLGRALSHSGEAQVPAAPPAPPEEPALSAPAADAFPAVLESFLYRYQLDMEFAFSFAAEDEPAAEAEADPPPSPQPLPVSREEVDPGSRRAVILGVFREVRIFHGRAFVQQADRFAQGFSPPTAEKIRRTSQNLARRFSLDFSLRASFLQQFARQRRDLAGQGEDTLNHYLDISNTLTLQSGGDAQSFFDQVDELLARAEGSLHQQVDAFLQETSARLGLSAEDTRALGDLLNERIAEFFAFTADFLSQAEAQLAAGPGESLPESAAPPPSLEPLLQTA